MRVAHGERGGRWAWLVRCRICLPPALVGALAALLYTTTAAPTITTRFGGTDGGELTAVAISGGVAHPSGYPTYLLLARLALRVFTGEPAHRLALLSAWSGALAVAGTVALLLIALPNSISARMRRPTIIAGVYGGLLLMTSERLWSQAVIAEVYALHLLLLALGVICLLAWLLHGLPLALIAAALCFGVGLGNHLTLLVALPAGFGAWLSMPQRPRLAPPLMIAALLAFLGGLSVYGLLPFWTLRYAVPSWGDATTLAGFWNQASGAEYRYLVGIVPWPQRLARLGFAVRDLVMQPGLLAVALAVGWGIPFGWRTTRPLFVTTAIIALGALLFAISYGGADGTVYLLPWTWVWCLWSAVGLYAVIDALPQFTRRRIVPRGLCTILAAALISRLVAAYPQMDLRAATVERDQRIAQIERLPPRTILRTDDDAATFGLWYVQRVLGIRSDVLVIDTRLLAQPWYQRQIRRILTGSSSQAVCNLLRLSQRPIYALTPAGPERLVESGVVCDNFQ